MKIFEQGCKLEAGRMSCWWWHWSWSLPPLWAVTLSSTSLVISRILISTWVTTSQPPNLTSHIIKPFQPNCVLKLCVAVTSHLYHLTHHTDNTSHISPSHISITCRAEPDRSGCVVVLVMGVRRQLQYWWGIEPLFVGTKCAISVKPRDSAICHSLSSDLGWYKPTGWSRQAIFAVCSLAWLKYPEISGVMSWVSVVLESERA